MLFKYVIIYIYQCIDAYKSKCGVYGGCYPLHISNQVTRTGIIVGNALRSALNLLAYVSIDKIHRSTDGATKNGTTKDIAGEMYTEIDTREAVKSSPKKERQAERTITDYQRDNSEKSERVARMARSEAIATTAIIVECINKMHERRIVARAQASHKGLDKVR